MEEYEKTIQPAMELLREIRGCRSDQYTASLIADSLGNMTPAQHHYAIGAMLVACSSFQADIWKQADEFCAKWGL